MFDGPRLALYVGLGATAILLVCLFFLVSTNSGSRNITLAAGTLIGAFIFLGTQLYYELQPSESKTIFGFEYTIDNEKRKIEQFRYPMSAASRASMEIEANKVLETNPTAFNGDAGKLWRDGENLFMDMSLWSLVAYLWTVQHDWKIKRDTIVSSWAAIEQFGYSSSVNESAQCTKVNWGHIHAMLRGISNVFSEAKPIQWEFMCLPPRSSIDVRSGSVKISTPFCTIDFSIDSHSIAGTNTTPDTGEVVLMSNNLPRYTTRTGIVRSTIRFDSMRAQSREMPKYEAWANDVVDRARTWFEPYKPGQIRVRNDFE